MKKAEYMEYKWKFSQMDTDYVVDILDISSQELIEAFPSKFEQFLNEEYNSEDYEEAQEGSISRSSFE